MDANDYDYARYIRENGADYAGDDILYVVPFSTYGASECGTCVIESNYDAALDIFRAYDINPTGDPDLFSFKGYLAVNLYRANSDGERLPQNGFTPAAIVGFHILSDLDDYPLLDESDFCEREYKAWESSFSDELRYASNDSDYLDDSEDDITAISEIAYEMYGESDYNSFCPDDIGDVSDLYRLARDKYYGDKAYAFHTAQIEGQGEFDV